jgi:small conductance mechanosensitive channel
VASAAVAVFGYLILKNLLLRYIHKLVRTGIDEVHAQQRVKTFERLILSVLKLFFVFFFLFTVLELFGLDVKALILSAGVAGLAVSFGAQSLIRDLIGGVLMLLEDQLALGDYVRIVSAGNIPYEGLVFSFASRFVKLIQPDGKTVYIPFGSIVAVENYRNRQNADTPEDVAMIVAGIEKYVKTKAGLFRSAYLPEEKCLFVFYYGSARDRKLSQKIEDALSGRFRTVINITSGFINCIIAKEDSSGQGHD